VVNRSGEDHEGQGATQRNQKTPRCDEY
jgi:hypothetical protein